MTQLEGKAMQCRGLLKQQQHWPRCTDRWFTRCIKPKPLLISWVNRSKYEEKEDYYYYHLLIIIMFWTLLCYLLFMKYCVWPKPTLPVRRKTPSKKMFWTLLFMKCYVWPKPTFPERGEQTNSNSVCNKFTTQKFNFGWKATSLSSDFLLCQGICSQNKSSAQGVS